MVNDSSGKVDARKQPREPELPDFAAESEPATEGELGLTRRVHVVLGAVVAALGAWLLYRSVTELPFSGENGEPGPGLLPVLLTTCLVALGLLLSVVSAFGPRARSAEAPTLSFGRAEISRALMVWLALAVCTALLEPAGFLLAGEVLILAIILLVERMRAIPQVIALLLLPPVFYLLFAVLLEVDLPIGTIWQ
ncbi:tripartite tricarboxylate transporter TctB family protein [Mycobacterium sp. ITM-2016-00317]|uniref:tripartite tricarboxylate transporter TctB family protein n=1 Tax=Mycobacterium sp. ITM-2016-00317 TaxID=2099694 RepID=UPI000D4C2236|nr:tripartite tricarboxylate transporter TctB family protein [Mycobacterium sp. ITM-2016-00317]WNG86336.1 tripartite tricarboxylate transporter TctB family protein [Mycobacterium sp. ITM-2016-00317]